MSDSNPKSKKNKEESADEEEMVSPSVESAVSIDDMLVVVQYRVKIAFASGAALILVALVWAFLGSIPVQVEGVGVIMSAEGLFTEEASLAGTVDSVEISAGEDIVVGQVLMRIRDPQVEVSYEAARRRLAILEEGVEDLQEEVDREQAADREAKEQELNAMKFRRERLIQELPKTKAMVERRRDLYEEGLISLDTLTGSEQTLSKRLIELRSVEAQLFALSAQMKRGHRTTELSRSEQELLQVRQEYEIAELRRNLGVVKASNDGRVLEVKVREGDWVQVGQSLVWCENQAISTKYLIHAYVPIDQGKKVGQGQRVTITVTTVNPQEYGMIEGEVVEVSPYAVSPETMSKTLQNSALGQYLLAGNPAVVEIIIRPFLDDETISGFRWTSGEGPPFTVSTGTVCSIKATVESVRPIHYLMPLWKLKKVFAPGDTSMEGNHGILLRYLYEKEVAVIGEKSTSKEAFNGNGKKQ